MGERPTSGAPQAAPRITIVDDDREIQELLREALEADGFEVTVVSNGLRLISALQVDQPDLVLLDVIMSWIDGFELCRAIKKNPQFKEIPIIFLSARSEPSDIETGFGCGCTDYLSKPVDLAKLRTRVREIIDGADKEQE